MGQASGPISVTVARTLDQWMQAMAVRTEVYIGEQDYAFGEEFDGADLAGATHFIARLGVEPVGACRVRWYAGFAKLERVAVKRAHRSGRVVRALWRAVADLASRKGYALVLGHIERSLLPFWQRSAGFEPRNTRPSYWFAGREFVEALAPLARHPYAIDIESPANALLVCEAELAAPAPLRVAS
jgi:predicted GNAT family N-acyltransferase